ncbi:MAG TPA: DUF1592 domain-containing protein, partial [Polyangiaceae bacterium LLY-WYZ-15_(1-7)]|nr:DUF1592 domain-containing protein [Polyangiaceae bacterium LLY-WYZ-15_(1-7)]
PLDAREQAAFEALFAAVAAEEVGWERAARAVAEAMLQSPGFLYLLQDELAGRGDGDGDANVRTLGGYEMASRLSYALWASAPDEALLDAAEAGELDEPAGIAAQVERMLEDEAKVARVTERFVVDWARLASLPDEDGRKGELMASAVAFYDDHARRGAPLYGLFDAERAFLTPALAEAWGLEPAGEGVRAYDLSGLDGRGGLLGQPGVIAGMTNADGGAIVARGLFLQHQVFCGSPPDPPASLQDEIDAFAAALPETASDREVFERRLMRAECAACHAQFDPLALAFERYDFRGAFREEDEHGNALDDRGWLPASLDADGAEVAYAGLGEYLGLVAAHPRARRCLVQRHAEQALGATLESGQIGAVVELAEAVGEEGSRADLLRALATHDLFRTQRVPE